MKKGTPFQIWKQLVKKTFTAFSVVWWRMAIVNLMTFLIVFGIVVLSVFGMVTFLFSGFQEFGDFLANQQFGGESNNIKFLILFLGFMLVIVLVIIGGVIGKVANWLVIRNSSKKKNENPFKTFFKDSWQFLGRYLWLSLKIFFYIVWPIVIGGVMILLSTILLNNPEGLVSIIPITLGVLLFSFTIYRIFRIIFASAFMIAANKNSKEAFNTSVEMVKNNWWFVFISIVSVVILISIPLFVMNFSDYLMSFGWDFSIANFKDFSSNTPQIYSPSFFVWIKMILSFFVVAPLGTSFMYFLMLNLVDNKKIKI